MLSFLVLAGPIIAERVKVPGMVGLIFLGMLFGPFVFGWVEPTGLIGIVGAIGLLYLMFLAGIELDVNTFIANRRASITFGLLTFAIPFGLSLYVGIAVLDYSGAAAALVGAMWASHTLVAYTEVKTAGLEANRAVGAAVSSTVITDVLSLLILGFAASADISPEPQTAHGDISIMPVWAGVLVLAGFCLWLLPRATRWFFVNVGHSRTQRFMWTFGGMAAGAFVSLLGGIEGLVGAFLAGIGMNRLVPAHGQLMERIAFFGNAIFIPAFLIAVGMSIDPSALTEGSTIQLALIFIGLVLVGKISAAVVSGLIFGLTWPEIGMMASLTIGQAAATLAIAQVGVSTGLFDQEILNAAVVAVVVTVIITSLTTRFFAKRLEPPKEDTSAIGKHVLMGVAPGGATTGLVASGVAITRPDDGLLTPFVICDERGCGDKAEELEAAVQASTDLGHDSEGVSRVAESEVSGTLNLALEQKASAILLPWRGPRFPSNLFFGADIDHIGRRARIPVIAAKVETDEWNRVVFFQGARRGLVIRDEDSRLALEVARRLAGYRDCELVVFSSSRSRLPDIDQYEVVHDYTGRNADTLAAVAAGDMVVVPPHVLEDALALGILRLSRTFSSASLLVVGGPGRLRVSNRPYGENVMGSGPAFKRGERDLLAAGRERSVT